MPDMNVARWSLLAAALAVAVTCAQQPAATPASTFPNLSAPLAWELVRKNQGRPDFVVLDVRTPAEFAAGHLPGAVNVDFHAPDFEARLGKLDKNRSYLVYCRTGNRSGKALVILERLGFSRGFHLQDGIADWQRRGLPVEPPPAPTP